MRKFNNISIRNKLIIIQAATAFLAILICCGIFVYNDIKTLKASSARKMYSVARVVGSNCVSPLLFMDEDATNQILSKLNNEPDIIDALVLDKAGKVFGKYSRTGANPLVVKTALSESKDPQETAAVFSGKELFVSYKIFQEKEFLGTVILKTELNDLNTLIDNYIKTTILVLVSGLIAALIISSILQRVITGPLLSLVYKTKEVTETGNYSNRVNVEGKDEVGILSKEFNAMLDQIEKMERSLKEANTDLEQRVQKRTAELETANKELESFSYSVSHDLKAPLRAIHSYSSILRKDYIDKLNDNDAKEISDTVIASAQKMSKLIEDLLAFSHLRGKEMIKNKINMNEMVKQIVKEAEDMEKGRSIEVKTDVFPSVVGDPDLLRQVWSNLIFNAFKYTRHKEKAEINIGCYPQKNEVVYYIKDNGAGFDMKYANKLFGVFQRLHRADEFEGTGVGLAIVNRIVTRHGGKVWAEGKVNEGATFNFSLPNHVP